MCSHPSAPDTTAQTNAQLAAQQQTSDQQLAQQKAIADQQNAFNQEQLDWQQQQADQQQQQVNEQSNRQSIWDTQRNSLAATGAAAVDQAFASFTPAYYQNYVNTQEQQSTAEIERQSGLTQKALTEKLADQGILPSSEAANQQGLLAEDTGRQITNYDNQAQTSGQQLQQQVSGAKNSLLSQVLSSDTLGSPIASGNDTSLYSNIDAANKAVAGLSTQAGDAATAISPVISSSIPANLFSSATSSLNSYLAGSQAAAVGSGLQSRTSGRRRRSRALPSALGH